MGEFSHRSRESYQTPQKTPEQQVAESVARNALRKSIRLERITAQRSHGTYNPIRRAIHARNKNRIAHTTKTNTN